MGLFNRLFGNEKKSTPAIPENKTGQEEQTPLYDPLAPQNNFQAMAKIRELNGYDNSTVKIVARLIKVAVEYWQIRLAQYFRSELGTNELRIVLGLLGSKCLIAPSTPCGKTTGIGIAALARYILLRDLKQIWIMPHGEFSLFGVRTRTLYTSRFPR